MNYMYKILIVLSLLPLALSCGKSPDQPIGNHDLLHARWIEDGRKWPVADSLMYGEFPAPLFRKEFTVGKDMRSAVLYITAAGYYTPYLNGEKVGMNYLDPAWTNYSKRIYYAEYDVTSKIKEGRNCLGAEVGNGFYNPLPIMMWGNLNLREILPVGKPKLIALLRIEYGDGRVEEVKTDRTWKYAYGPVLKNNVYLGEVFDAGKETEGWNTPGFKDTGWKRPLTHDGPGGQLQKAFFPHVQITDTIRPVLILSPGEGITILDMGVNYTGLYRIRLNGQPGDTVVFRFAERLYDDGTLNPMTSVCGQVKKKGMGGPGAPEVAWQTDRYIFGKETEAWFYPTFTFHVFRYMEIRGLKYKPALTDMEGIALNTNVPADNSFSCSSGLINAIQEASRRTFTNNLVSVQSDCPAREKFGYGGDLNATCEAFISNYDMENFYRKTIYDWLDAMNDTTFIDAVPYIGIKYCGLSWESAFLITQYKLLVYYNDTGLIRELYEKDLKWMDKAGRLHPSGVVDRGLSDHESLVKVPVQLIGTTHYLQCARIMTHFAALMNDKENGKRFAALAEELSGIVLYRFWKKPVTDTINRQTLFATLLYHDIIPEKEKGAAIDSLFKALKKAPAGHFTTGIFGTQYILESLSATGHRNTVFQILNNREFPGWGYMIGRGATTIWETWKESDNVYSNCHPMFGSVSHWFYRWLAGIQPNPEYPGFEKFFITPMIPEGLSYVKCSYHCPSGKISANWEKVGKGVKFEIAVPPGTEAKFNIIVPKNATIEIENLYNKEISTLKISGTGFEKDFKEGNYTIRY